MFYYAMYRLVINTVLFWKTNLKYLLEEFKYVSHSSLGSESKSLLAV